MDEGLFLIAFITAQRILELLLAQSNTARLMAAGGYEVGRSHYHWIVALHASWLGGLWLLGHDRPLHWLPLAVFVLLQVGRLWVIVSLGRRWTTRVIVVPGAKQVTRGPYRWLKHPNYLIVALEIVVVPLALGMPGFAAFFCVLNGIILYHRIRVEDAALAQAQAAGSKPQTLANERQSL